MTKSKRAGAVAAPHGVFISYRRVDTGGDAGRLADHLVKIFGADRVFFDVAAIAGGDDWRQRLDGALDGCDTMLVVIGRGWLEGPPGQRRIDDPKDMVAWEVARGLTRGLRVVQILVHGVSALTTEWLPPPIAGLAMRQAVSLHHETFVDDVRDLASQIRRSRRTQSAFAGDWLTSDLSPWVPRVIDSGTEGTVAAITVVNALELLLARAGFPERLSLRYLYEKAQRSGPTGTADSADDGPQGVFLLAAIFVAGLFGVPREAIWPYKPNSRKLPRRRTWLQLENRLGWCCRGDFFRTDGLADAVRQLAAGRPVIMALDFFDDNWEPRTGEVQMPRHDAPVVGAGTVLLVGYDSTRRRFRFANTWGPKWGDGGFGTIELDVARRVVQPDQMWSVELAAVTTADIREARAGAGPLAIAPSTSSASSAVRRSRTSKKR